MSVQQLSSGGGCSDVNNPSSAELPERFHKTLEFAVLASKQDPFDPAGAAASDSRKGRI
jgi:P-type Ca2+ transporter type 2C